MKLREVVVKTQAKKLTIVLPTEAKLEDVEKIGLLSRWKFYFEEYSKHFDIEVYSCDTRDFSKVLHFKHHPLQISLNFMPYGNQILYNFYLLIKAPFMSKIVRIISVSYLSLPLIKAFKKEIVLSFHYDYETTTKKDFGGIKGFTSGVRQYLSIKSAAIIIVTTEELRKKVKEIYKRKAIVIPNFVDTSKFFPSMNRENYILYAGRIYWHKGIDYLIEAFVEVEKKHAVTMKLAGLGDIEYYEKKVKKLGIRNIKFLRRVDNLELPELMRKAKIFILPTITSEGHPKALIEAMASGCACIATDVPGNRELIQNGKNGLLVKPRDIHSLTEAISKVLDNEELRIGLQKNARLTAKKFSIKNTLHKEIELLINFNNQNKNV